MSRSPLLQFPNSQSSGGGSVAVAGQGWLLSWHGWPFAFSGNVGGPYNAAGTQTANVLNCLQIVVPFGITVRKFTTEIGQVVLGQQFGMGLYDASGNLLVQAGVSTGAIGRITVAVGPITLSAGQVIYTAYSSGTLTSTVDLTFVMPATTVNKTQGPAAWNMNAVRAGVANNVFAANLMPNSLGGINEYAMGVTINHAGFIMEP